MLGQHVRALQLRHVPQLQVPGRVAAEVLGWLLPAAQPGRGASVSRSASSPV